MSDTKTISITTVLVFLVHFISQNNIDMHYDFTANFKQSEYDVGF